MPAQLTSLLHFNPMQTLSSKCNVAYMTFHNATVRCHSRCRHSTVYCSAQAPAQDTQLHPLSVWLESRDVPAKRLGTQPKIVEGKLCLVATRSTTKGQTLAAIPQKAWLTQQTVSDSPIGVFVEELDGWLQICLYLLHEQSKQQSVWGPYIASLPREVDLPLFWSEQELQELQGTQLLTSVEGYRCRPPALPNIANAILHHVASRSRAISQPVCRSQCSPPATAFFNRGVACDMNPKPA